MVCADIHYQLIRTAKETFTRCGNLGPIIAGAGSAQSTREAIDLCADAASVGADFALVLPTSYYPGAMPPAAIQKYFEDVSVALPS
jgi:4-hydroxy-2-oxoglutarate aldolase